MRSAGPAFEEDLPGSAAPATPVPAVGSAYWAFYDEVAARQVRDWAPAAPSRVLDLSSPCPHFALVLAAAGHEVVHVGARPAGGGPVRDAAGGGPAGGLGDDGLPSDGSHGDGLASDGPDVDGPDVAVVPGDGVGAVPPGRVLSVLADARQLDWLADGCVDAVLAESRALSRCLAAEVTAAELCRVLRPGGLLLLVVESLGLGLARLAEQGRWAELADVPNADVVLVPGDGDDLDSITRCFWPEELVALVEDAGLEVDWVRPRTVLSVATVERAMASGGRAALATLATSELRLEEQRGADAPGLHLVLSARRPR